MRDTETSVPSLGELNEAATQGEWHHRQAGKTNSGGPLDWIGDAPDGSAHTKIIVGRQCLYGGSDDYAFVARLVSNYRAGRLIDPTAIAEAVASARAEGVREGLERAAAAAENLAAKSRLIESWWCETSAKSAAAGIRALITGGSSDV